MFANRTIMIVAALIALLISSCSQGTQSVAPAEEVIPSFDLNETERAALALGDDSSLTVEFGDPTLGAAVFGSVPSSAMLDQLQGNAGAGRTASVAGAGGNYNNDDDCRCNDEPCGPCDGKVTELTLRYNGAAGGTVTVTSKKGTGTIFSGTVAPGGEFSFSGNDKNGTLGTEIQITINGQTTAIHTSCSQPIEAGMDFGPFTILAGRSLNGGPLCGDVDDDCDTGDCDDDCDSGDCPDDDCGPCDGKVTELTLRYNGAAAGNVSVSSKKGTGTVFSGTVAPGGEFSFSGNDKGGTLGTEINITVNGQTTAIHTSCSQPIGPGMDFGPFTVIAGRSLNGGALCPGGDSIKDKKKDKKSSKCSKCGKSDCSKFWKYYDKYLKKKAKYGCDKAGKYLQKALKYRGACCNPPVIEDCQPSPCDCDCSRCRPEKCRKITGVCNLTERFWENDDFCSAVADVTYVGQVEVDGDGANLAGIEVVFSRDGVEVGRALTNAEGKASFIEAGVQRGPHKVTVCVAAARTGGCRTGNPCGDPKCPSHQQACRPTITANFTKDSLTVTSSKDLSNVVLKFCDGCIKKFDGLCGTTGTFMGYGSYAGKTIAGAWIKSGCNSSGDGPGYGEWFANPFSDCECKPCITYDGCSNCSSSAENGKYCSTLDIAVYTDKIQGAVTGTGYINACNPLRIGSRAGMNFRAAYDNGAVQGYLNFWDGSIKVTNGQIKWLLISGVESWFGGDNWMVHVVDNGVDFRNDTFEIWIWDPVTNCCYHCGGRLVGCYVNVSYRWSQKCP